MAPRDLEPYIGSRGRVSEVLSGSRPLSIDMIRAPNQHLGIPAASLIQSEVPETKAAEASPSTLYELKKSGIMRVGEPYQNFLDRAWSQENRFAMLRASMTARTNVITDHSVLQAWCALAAIRSEDCELKTKFDALSINFDYVRSLAELSVREDGPRYVAGALAEVGVAFVVQPHFGGTYLDGAALLRGDGCQVVALTIRHDRADNIWFTLLHELAHVAKHLSGDTVAIFDDLDIRSATDVEAEADRLAEAALVPPETWNSAALSAYASISDLMALAAAAGVSPSIVAGRWQRLHGDYRKFSKLIERNNVRRLFTEVFP